MGFLSALNTMGKSGDAFIIPAGVKQDITRLENLGGRLAPENIVKISENSSGFSSTQRASLLKAYEGKLINGVSDQYESWIKWGKDNPEGSVYKRKTKELDAGLLGLVLRNLEKQNGIDNLEAVKTANKGKSPKEMVSYIDVYELRPSFPKGYENVEGIRKYDKEVADAGRNINRYTEEVDVPKEVDFKSLKRKGNVISVDFKSLKPKL
tara:strand:+ start:630 stop:1256 length:627 start_codon:yes stop_codon:yes gene_type:complete